MTRFSLVALLCALPLVLATTAGAQTVPAAVDTSSAAVSGRTPGVAAPVEDDDLTYDDFTVKAYTLTLYGGWFSGGTFLELPPIDGNRTYVEEGTDRIYGYDGEFLNLDPKFYDAAVKKIEAGPAYGGKLAVYLSDAFHIDITGSYSQGKATTSMRNKQAPEREDWFREQVDEDDGFSVLMGGLNLVYDSTDFRILGLRPYLGFGVGGIINSFTALDDATGLYFQGVGGMNLDVTDKLAVVGQFQVTTFSFSRQELDYGKQVTYGQAFVGLSYFFDVLPEEVRAAREASRDQ
ncbi:MAG: hypothetical protein R6X25_14425 [Candidatus Krumholzibacteriia bacterium]